ncbi:YbjQ family protein [Tindallia californiensis]|uniref:Uncharacterized conserved protein YbjQ, UPF0145 family n=1 Tax=Tindallia californiensis TaxID=159292 RepID=A0A1H3NY53_9FIRM|nr:YbjQ family protein [Tindallia californiensis]SDY93119.1 Uncharacterized conserved protein YbjQ, UPF0145 family [Tindallia californiensis]
MEDSQKLYERAYELHYTKGDLIAAYGIYEDIVKNYPNQKEAKYSHTQMMNIQNAPDFDISHIDQKSGLKNSEYRSERETIRDLLQNMIVTSGYHFEGYKINEYLGFISAETVLGMGIFRGLSATVANLAGTESAALRGKLKSAKKIVMEEIMMQAAERGANAIVGVDLDYTMFGGELLGIIVSGTAVEITEIE